MGYLVIRFVLTLVVNRIASPNKVIGIWLFLNQLLDWRNRPWDKVEVVRGVDGESAIWPDQTVSEVEVTVWL